MTAKAVKPLPDPRVFFWHLVESAALAIGLTSASLLVGMIGYHGLEGQSWIDAYLNASMILSGMGPASELHTNAGKIFAGLYAIYSGLALITIAGIMLAPVVRRFLHRFHLENL